EGHALHECGYAKHPAGSRPCRGRTLERRGAAQRFGFQPGLPDHFVFVTTVVFAQTARTPRQLVFSCRLTFVRTSAAFSTSVLQPVARWVPLVSERALRPLALLGWAAQVQALSAAVSPLALCVSPSFLSSVFARRCALRPPTRYTPYAQNRSCARR